MVGTYMRLSDLAVSYQTNHSFRAFGVMCLVFDASGLVRWLDEVAALLQEGRSGSGVSEK